MPSSITTPPTNSPTSSNGLPIIRAGRSISRRPRPRGSTPSRASSPPSRAAEYAAEPSHPSETCKMRSTATSTPTTTIVGRWYGQRPPKPSSKNSIRSLYLLSHQCTTAVQENERSSSAFAPFGTSILLPKKVCRGWTLTRSPNHPAPTAICAQPTAAADVKPRFAGCDDGRPSGGPGSSGNGLRPL